MAGKRDKPEEIVAILAGERGKAYGADYFGHRLRAAIQAPQIGEGDKATSILSGCAIHGLRYTAATLLYEAGIDDETIGFFTGHQSIAMVKKYSRKRGKTSAAVARMSPS